MKWNLVALGLALAVVGAMGCSSECGPNASCPVLVWFGGARYAVGSGKDLTNIDGALTPLGSRDSTNLSAQFADETVFQIDPIDPSAILVARAAAEVRADLGNFLVLWGPNQSLAYPTLCQYFTAAAKAIQPECGGVQAT